VSDETAVWILIHHVTDGKSKILGVYDSEPIAVSHWKLAKEINGWGEIELVANVVLDSTNSQKRRVGG